MEPPPLTWLYAPADRPDRVEKALASGAHAVIVDLEDAVAPARKTEARAALVGLLATPHPVRVLVRINGLASPWWREDVEALRGLAVDAIGVPKVESSAGLDAVAQTGFALHCLVESALGVERAFEIASHPAVVGISLGESDLRGELAVEEPGLDWARSRIVNAAVAAGLPRPPQSVYPHPSDLAGLAQSCARGRALGHLGRAAIHPRQLDVILDAYLPSEGEATAARELVAAFEEHERGGVGAFTLEGAFVDAAVVRSARTTVALADAYATRTGP